MKSAVTILREVPAHLTAAQLLVSRCPDAEDRRGLILMLWVHGALGEADAEMLAQVNGLEGA